MFRLSAKPAWRPFSTSLPRHKDDYKKLKSLGSQLLQGKVGEGRRLTPVKVAPPPDHLSLDAAVKENIDDLEDSFEKVAFMTKDDIAIQENLDGGRQFGGFAPLHFFDRRELIRSLPDEVDMQSTPWTEIDRVYRLLERLDRDAAVHAKYLKKFGIHDHDLVTKFRLGNNLRDMCQAGRRGEKYEVPKGLERVFRKLYRYNVVGFDRSLVGVPLRSGKHAVEPGRGDYGVPAELIRDMRPFDTKVPVHKMDVNYLDEDQLKESISPFDPKPLAAEEMLRDVGKPIFFDSIEQYRKVGHPAVEVLDRIEKETLQLKDALYLEMARKMAPGADAVGFNSPRVKTNEWVVAARAHDATTVSGPTTSYQFRQFDLVPVYGVVLATVKHYNRLYRHLFRVILINMADHVDVLTRVKYRLPHEADAFMRKLYGKIHRVVAHRLMPVALRHRLRVPKQYHAVLHKHNLSGNFLRICWVRKPTVGLHAERTNHARKVRRSAQALNILILNPPHFK